MASNETKTCERNAMLIKKLVAAVKAKLEEDRIPSYLEFKADPEKYIQYYIQKHQDDQR